MKYIECCPILDLLIMQTSYFTNSGSHFTLPCSYYTNLSSSISQYGAFLNIIFSRFWPKYNVAKRFIEILWSSPSPETRRYSLNPIKLDVWGDIINWYKSKYIAWKIKFINQFSDLLLTAFNKSSIFIIYFLFLINAIISITNVNLITRLIFWFFSPILAFPHRCL